jgi:hypothetical protein
VCDGDQRANGVLAAGSSCTTLISLSALSLDTTAGCVSCKSECARAHTLFNGRAQTVRDGCASRHDSLKAVTHGQALNVLHTIGIKPMFEYTNELLLHLLLSSVRR